MSQDDDLLTDLHYDPQVYKVQESWNTQNCQGCGQIGHYYGAELAPDLPYFCKTCVDILRGFFRAYRKQNADMIPQTQRKREKIRYYVLHNCYFGVESNSRETTEKLMQHFMDYVKSAPRGIHRIGYRGLFLCEDYPTSCMFLNGITVEFCATKIMVAITSPIDLITDGKVMSRLIYLCVNKMRTGAITLNNTVVGDVDKYIFDAHNSIIAIRYMFAE